MEYKLVYTIFIEDVEMRVNKYIKDGWIPQGGVSQSGGRYMQAMVKPTPTKEKDITNQGEQYAIESQ